MKTIPVTVQFMYSELSVFTSLMALVLSSFFYQARLGVANPMAAEIIKSLGLSLLLLNLPHHIVSSITKSSKQVLPWYISHACITMLVLSIIVLGSFIIQDKNYAVDYAVSAIGYISFIIVLVKYSSHVIFKDRKINNLFFLCGCLAFSFWVTGFAWGACERWGSIYLLFLSPLFGESISLTGGGNTDTLIHSSIAHMIQTYGIPSSGLDGLPYMRYHFASHWIFAQLAKLIRISVIDFYQLCYPVIFLPLFFYSILLFTLELRNYSGIHGEDRQDSLFGVVGFILFAAGFISFLPSHIAVAVGLNNLLLISQSYLVSAVFAFLLFCLIIIFWKSFTIHKHLSRIDQFLIVLLIPGLIACVGLAKISVMVLLFAVYSYVLLRLALFKSCLYIVSYSMTVFVMAVVMYYTMPISSLPYSIQFLNFLKYYVSPQWRGFYLLFHYFWSFLVICLMIKMNAITNMVSLKNSFLNKTTIGCEIVIILSIAGFLPGAVSAVAGVDAQYFSDFQRWFSLSLLVALCSNYKVRLKPETFVIMLFFVPFMHTMYKNASEQFIFCRDQVARLRREITTVPSEKIEILSILKKLNELPLSQKRNTLLFIPQNNSAYWNLADSIGCPAVPFVAPALSGIALIDGLPLTGCVEKFKDRETHMDYVFRNCSYECYTLRDTDQSDADREDGSVCAKATEKGFHTIIRIDQTEGGGGKDLYNANEFRITGLSFSRNFMQRQEKRACRVGRKRDRAYGTGEEENQGLTAGAVKCPLL